jgi:predicted enzyme related to lactoylglutathione lyase
MITGVAGVAIWSEDSKKLMPFYRDVLGLPEVHMEGEDPEESANAGYFSFGQQDGPWLGLGTHSEVKGRASDPYRHMVGLRTTDVHADVARLKGLGVEFIEDPKDYGGGFWIATLKDPEGNVVQLFQFPD